MKKTTQSFIEKDGKLLVQTVITEDLSDTGCIYLALPKERDKDRSHLIYKLHGFRKEKEDKYLQYIWIGLWNSSCQHHPFGGVKRGPHHSIQDAIQWITTDTANGGGGFKVIKCNFSDLVSGTNLDALYKKTKNDLRA